MSQPELESLIDEYDRALGHTDTLWRDLPDTEIRWRPHENASAIAWHLGHQALVAHFMIRNLTAAEESPDPGLEAVMDSATPEPRRGDLPDTARISEFRDRVAARVRFRIRQIADGEVGAAEQLAIVAAGLLTAVVNHEYQHAVWIAEVRARDLGRSAPPPPTSPLLRQVDGYTVLAPWGEKLAQ